MKRFVVSAITLSLIAGLLCMAAGTGRAYAATSNWIDTNSNWNNVGNWDNGVPNSSSTDAVINHNSSTVTLDVSASIGSLTIGSGNTLTTNLGTALTVFGTQISNDGQILVNGGGGSNTSLVLRNNVTLSGAGTLTMNVAGGGGSAFIQQGAGGLTLANQSTINGAGTIGNGGLALSNSGTINANASGQVLLLNGSGGITNASLLEASSGGILQIDNTTVNNAGGNITANGAGSVQLFGNAVIQGGTLNNNGGGFFGTPSGNAAYLDGTTQGPLTINGTYTSDLNTTTRLYGTITNNGNIQLNGGNGTNSSLSLGNDVTLQGSGTVTLSTAAGGGNAFIQQAAGGLTLTNVNNTIQGSGIIGQNNLTLVNQAGGIIDANSNGNTLAIQALSGKMTNDGTLRAESGGILTVTQGFAGTGGTARSDGASQLNVGASSTVGTLINNGSLSNSLNLGANTITVYSDYSNANFGVGNAFNNRANVAGTGQILAAGDVKQAVTGVNLPPGSSLANGGTATPTLTIGNVHVGANTFNYQVAPTGTTGPSLRGATQTINGGNISDARLSVTPGSWGPVAPGGTGSNLGVTFTAASAGALSSPLSGQVIHIANNFDNVAGQNLSIVLGAGAAAYNLAAGAATPLPPVTIANQRIGGTNSQPLTIANTAPGGNFTEVLNASFGSNSGNATNNGGSITGGLGTGGVAVGSPNSTAMSVGVDTSAAGFRSGSVTVNYASNGMGTSGLGTTNLPLQAQTITVQGNVIAYANPQLTGTLNFGAVATNSGAVQRAISVSNPLNAPSASFQDSLNATFGTLTNTGVGSYGTTGSVTGLAAGAPANTNMVVTFTPGATTGAISGNVQIQLVSDGTSFGLGTKDLGFQPVTFTGSVTGLVFNQAQGQATPTDVNFGNVRINTAQGQNLTISNIAPAPPNTEGLNANFGSNTGAATNNNGTITSLPGGAPGNPAASNSANMSVGLDTTAAGHRSGTAVVNFLTDGSISGNPPSSVGSQVINVSGDVYRLANPQLNTTSVNLVARVGDTAPSANVNITNSSPDIYTEGLNVTRGATASGFTSSGSISNLAAGATSTSAIQVALNTATAGTFTGGTQALNYVSTGAGTTGAPDISVGSGSVSLTGNVYTPAVASVGTTSIDFGIVHVGDGSGTLSRPVSVTNGATATALNDVLVGSISAGASPFSGSGNLGAGVAAGQTDNASLKVALATGTAGTFTGNADLALSSHNGDMTDLALTTSSIPLSAQVNNYANPVFDKVSGDGGFSQTGSLTYELDFGTLLLNSGLDSASLRVLNNVGDPADLLDGAFILPPASAFNLTGFNSFSDIAAGAAFAGLSVRFNPTAVGDFSDTIMLQWTGHNASGYSGPLGNISLVLEAHVTGQVGVPEPSVLLLLVSGFAGIGLLRRRFRG